MSSRPSRAAELPLLNYRPSWINNNMAEWREVLDLSNTSLLEPRGTHNGDGRNTTNTCHVVACPVYCDHPRRHHLIKYKVYNNWIHGPDCGCPKERRGQSDGKPWLFTSRAPRFGDPITVPRHKCHHCDADAVNSLCRLGTARDTKKRRDSRGSEWRVLEDDAVKALCRMQDGRDVGKRRDSRGGAWRGYDGDGGR